MSKKSQETGAVVGAEPRPAAAYLLGGHSRMLSGWLKSIDEIPWSRDYFGLQPATVINLNEMDSAVLNLRDVIEAEVLSALRAAIGTVKDCITDEFDYYGAVQNWAILCSEADRAFPHSHPQLGWYSLGKVVGKYQQMITSLEWGERLPDLRGFLDPIRQQLEESGEKVPTLQQLVDLEIELTTRPVYTLYKLFGDEHLL